jgi:hypothetical protein
MLDSTAIPLDVCVELLATAARSFTLDAPAGRATGEGGPADAEA